MDTPLPSNEHLVALSDAVPWQEIERQRRQFNRTLEEIRSDPNWDTLPLEVLSAAVGVPISTYFDPENPQIANILLAQANGHQIVMGGAVSARYHAGKSFPQSVVPYNLNPSVNHTNIHETDDPVLHMRPLGAEIELGVVHPDGHYPTEEQMQEYMRSYYANALKIGIYPRLDREACQYQVEAHIAPGIGYQKTRQALSGIMNALVMASEATGLQTTVLSTYPVESDFKTTDDPKVHTAVDLMLEVNSYFPEYQRRLEEAKQRYQMDASAHYVNVFRNQGTHIHIDLAGRSEALGLFTFYTMLRSATAVANAAVLKGGPFVNGTCDAELLCTREYLRSTTVTGRYIDVPLSPHLMEGGMERFGALLQSERVNAMARALLYEDGLGDMVSAMHNPIGRIRPDLTTGKRICTVESTGMPTNISVSRMASILTDFEFSHTIMENYFRKYGCDLQPMYEDKTLWAILGPLDTSNFIAQQDQSDRLCTDMILTTADGQQMSLMEFYEMKRNYMHKALSDIVEITPRDIDDVYISLMRMLKPPSGQEAQTVEQFIKDPKRKSTGNWGRILRDAFIEEGGVPGTHNPAAVLRVVNRIHEALRQRYLQD
jgi:hypothetical protein